MRKVSLKLFVTVVFIILVLLGMGMYLTLESNFNKDKVPMTDTNSTQQTAPSETKTTQTLAERFTEEQLLYLIEEEKLAHDVYAVMHQKYGANVFGNILQSESTHQGRVLILLQTRNITDPRSTEVGVFRNQDLQDLYNQLIERGYKNVTEAYKVGVAIEEKDITDISTQLATATDEDVIATLEALRRGSENHLRAFNGKL